jgi:hypothetical protein
MAVVYVVHNKGFDLTPAKKFGDIVVLCDGSPPDIFMITRHAHLIKQKLKNMKAEDYLACTGNLILNILAFGIVLETFGYVNVLLYDVKTEQYVPRLVAKHQLILGGQNG